VFITITRLGEPAEIKYSLESVNRGMPMSTAAERAEQLALVSRLKTVYPEVPEWPTPDEISHSHWLAYMKTPHDVGGELDYPHPYENKEEEQWKLMTYVLCGSSCLARDLGH